MNFSAVELSERLRSPHGQRQMVARLRIVFDAVRRERTRPDARGGKHSIIGDESRSELRAREARIERERQALHPGVRGIIRILARQVAADYLAGLEPQTLQESPCASPSTVDIAPTFNP